MIQNHSRCTNRLWARIALGALLLLPAEHRVFASYKIQLKDGKIVEAKTKPVSMEGTLRFTAVDGSFRVLPVTLVDLGRTEKLNPASSGNQPAGKVLTKVLTNDDLARRANEHRDEGEVSVAKPERPGTGKGVPKNGASVKEQKRDESYWRARAKQIRDQIAAVDNEIKKLDENAASGKADGSQIGYGAYTQYLVLNLEDQRKKLEKNKQDLEGQMKALEDEARMAGAMPGWLR